MNKGEFEQKFKGKKALIVGDHPHSGSTSTFVRIDIANGLGKAGLVFRNPNSDEEFFVFEPKHIQWINERRMK